MNDRLPVCCQVRDIWDIYEQAFVKPVIGFKIEGGEGIGASP